jgi:hypothetical protein
MTASPIDPPTAVQSDVEGHETPEKSDREKPKEGTVWVTQVVPPSVVATMAAVNEPSAPTAVQSEVEGHETPLRPPIPEGAVWVSHVAPPSVVATMAAFTLPPESVLPTAVQSEEEGHETPVSVDTAAGTR